MLQKFGIKFRAAAATAAVASIFTIASPAQAIVWTGAWDPAFGSAFPDLGWRGEARFFLPDACSAEQGWVFNSESCSSFGMKILSAEVEFYKLSDPTNTIFQETLSFDVPSPDVFSMELDNGVLTGVKGGFLLYTRSSTLPLAGGPFTDFGLFFDGDIAYMGYVSKPPEGPRTSGYSDISPTDGPFITFRLVPEPGGLTLLFLGVAALTLLRQAGRAQLRPTGATRHMLLAL